MFDFSLLLSAIVLISLDYVYLKTAQPLFASQVQKVQKSALQIRLLPAALCYILLITGLNYFIIKPRKSVNEAFLLGIVLYGVFETTNLALLKDWQITTVFVDTLWGGLLFGTTTFLVNYLRNLF